MHNIVIVGSSNTDLVVKTKIPAPGETVVGDDYFVNPGGKGANQAVAVARLGGRAAFVARVGDDDYGRQSIANYKKSNLDVTNVITDRDAHSGVAFIAVDETGENSIIVSSGANRKLCRSDIDNARDLIVSAEIVLMQLEIPMDVVEYVTEMASANGVKVIINPAPAAKLSREVLSKLYLITPNEKECEMLTGIQVTDCESKKEAAKVLLNSGVQNVIVTVGSKGSCLVNRDGVVDVPAIPQKAVDTTAAGDIYNGALCVALSEGKTLPEAMKFATAASSISVTRMGAQASIPTRQEVEALLEKVK